MSAGQGPSTVGAGAPADDHDAADFRESYRDALDFLDAAWDGDGRAARLVEERTPCADCLLHSVAQIGSRLGDRRRAELAAAEALDHLARLADGDL